MSEPIKPGDLVLVVKPSRCGCTVSCGMIFTAGMIRSSDSGGYCVWCLKNTFAPDMLLVEWPGKDGCVEMGRLKRIPPLGELEGEKRDEKLTEPA